MKIINAVANRIVETVNVCVLQDLKVMVFKVVQMLMNARKRKHVSALNAAARIPGAATSALVVETYCI